MQHGEVQRKNGHGSCCLRASPKPDTNVSLNCVASYQIDADIKKRKILVKKNYGEICAGPFNLSPYDFLKDLHLSDSRNLPQIEIQWRK